MAKWSLITSGSIIILAVFTFANVVITPQMRLSITAAENLFSSPIGQALAGLGPELAGTAQTVTLVSRFLAAELYFYLAGAFIIALGLLMGRRKEGNK